MPSWKFEYVPPMQDQQIWTVSCRNPREIVIQKNESNQDQFDFEQNTTISISVSTTEEFVGMELMYSSSTDDWTCSANTSERPGEIHVRAGGGEIGVLILKADRTLILNGS